MNTITETPQTTRGSGTESAAFSKTELLRRFLQVRGFSKKICETLEPEDCVIQTMPEASPTKWHLAHTSWFFEEFVLKQFFLDYHSLHPQYGFLFNSYYNAVGPFYSRLHRACPKSVDGPRHRSTNAVRGRLNRPNWPSEA